MTECPWDIVGIDWVSEQFQKWGASTKYLFPGGGSGVINNFFFYLFLLNYYTFTRSEVIKFYHLSVESSVGTIISFQPVIFQTLTDENPCTELHSPFIRVCLCINPVLNLASSEARLRIFSTTLRCLGQLL